MISVNVANILLKLGIDYPVSGDTIALLRHADTATD
jgi:hypothetical protein